MNFKTLLPTDVHMHCMHMIVLRDRPYLHLHLIPAAGRHRIPWSGSPDLSWVGRQKPRHVTTTQ